MSLSYTGWEKKSELDDGLNSELASWEDRHCNWGNVNPGFINPAVDELWWFPQVVIFMATEMVPPQLNSRLGFINPGLTVLNLGNVTCLDGHDFWMVITCYPLTMPRGISWKTSDTGISSAGLMRWGMMHSGMSIWLVPVMRFPMDATSTFSRSFYPIFGSSSWGMVIIEIQTLIVRTQFTCWAFHSHGGTPLSLDGLAHGKSHQKKWMIGGYPEFQNGFKRVFINGGTPKWMAYKETYHIPSTKTDDDWG